MWEQQFSYVGAAFLMWEQLFLLEISSSHQTPHCTPHSPREPKIETKSVMKCMQHAIEATKIKVLPGPRQG